MARSKRPWGVYMGPVIFVVGMLGFWGAKSAFGWKERVNEWSYALEHSAAPVVLEMPSVPIIPPLIINNQRMGRIESIVVQRDRPGAVDSVRLVASLEDGYRRHLEDCNLRFRLRLDGNIDVGDLKRALRCTSDVEGLVPFGSLAVAESDFSLPILVRVDDLPCGEVNVDMGPCRGRSNWEVELRAGLREMEEGLRAAAEEMRANAEEMRANAEEIRAEARARAVEVRARVRGNR